MAEQRKLVTILFVDTVGSTALGEQLDPEDARALMGRYYEHAQNLVAKHGGALEKFIGDAVMAVYGLPQAHSNDAERALATALALFQAVAGDPMLAGRLTLRAGVNTGDVVASSDVTRGDFLVTGDAVNVAARLEQAAAPGEILAGERTATAAEASFSFGEARAITVRGKSRPVRVHPLVEQRPTRLLGRPPLVGRKPDLAQLTLLSDRTRAERRPQLVSLVAEAGTGKTRLLEEFLARLAPSDGFRMATSRCLPYGQTLTYWPLRGLLDELLDCAPGAMTAERIVAAYTSGGHTHDDAERLAGLILATLGVEEESGERESIFGAWRVLIEALASQTPRIVVFEDLHWASDSLLDLVEHIMQPRTEAALLIIATSRPELLTRRPAWGGGRRSFTALALEPLSEEETRTLVGKLSKKTSRALREQIVQRSGGNPFFAIELTHALAGRDQTTLATGRAEGASDALPDTVQEALQEQLDLLSADERAVLQAASVAGRTFRPATLSAVLTTPAPLVIETALDGLMARDLITPADGAYTFRHILIRDVAYGALTRAERIRMHAAVGDWLEAFAGDRADEFAELIAFHYREAATLARQSMTPQNASQSASQSAARAVRYLERAADLAHRTGAFEEARRHLHHAIELAPESDHLRLYEALGDCSPFGDDTMQAYKQVWALWRAYAASGSAPELANPLTGARVLRKMLTVHLRWGGSLTERPSLAELTALRDEARRLAAAANDEGESWRLRAVDQFWSYWTGEVDVEEANRQMPIGLQAAAYFEAHGDWSAFSEALDGYGSLASDLNDHKAASVATRRRLASPEVSGFERGDALAMLVLSEIDAGDYAQAAQEAAQAIAQRRPGESAMLLQHAAAQACHAAYIAGLWPQMKTFEMLLDELWEQIGIEGGLGPRQRSYAALMSLALAREDHMAAERAAATLATLTYQIYEGESRVLSNAFSEASLRDDPSRLQTDLWALSGNPHPLMSQVLPVMFLSERGVVIPRTHLDLIEGKRIPRDRDAMRQCLQIAGALAADDNARLAQAIEEAEAHHLIPHAARMRIVLTQRTGDRAPLERARATLERLGDRQFLRRLEEVAAALG